MESMQDSMKEPVKESLKEPIEESSKEFVNAEKTISTTFAWRSALIGISRLVASLCGRHCFKLALRPLT